MQVSRVTRLVVMALTYLNELMPDTLVDMAGDVKIREEKDHRNPSTSDFIISKEDHTLANLLRMKLHKNSMVKFAGYRVPHPTQHTVVLKIQTASDGSTEKVPRPLDALDRAIGECLEDLEAFRDTFETAISRANL